MTEELSAFELLVTIENERKRQARIAEDALPAADSLKVPRKYCPCSAWRDWWDKCLSFSLSLPSPFMRMLLPSLSFFHVTSPTSSTFLLILTYLISSYTPCNCLNIRRQQNGLHRTRTFHRNQISGLRSRMCWRETARHAYALATIRSTHLDLRSEAREPTLLTPTTQPTDQLTNWLTDWALILSPPHFPRLPSVSMRTCAAVIHSQHCK